MNIDAVITQIKTFAPIFQGNVAGAASYAQAADQVFLPQPAAYVIDVSDETEPNQDMNGVYQIVREKIGVIVDLDNRADQRGQAAATSAVNTMRAALWAALLGWRPDPQRQSRGFAYAGGGLIGEGINRQYLRWQFDFVIETTIEDEDGWQPSSAPLSIEGAYRRPEHGRHQAELQHQPELIPGASHVRQTRPRALVARPGVQTRRAGRRARGAEFSLLAGRLARRRRRAGRCQAGAGRRDASP